MLLFSIIYLPVWRLFVYLSSNDFRCIDNEVFTSCKTLFDNIQITIAVTMLEQQSERNFDLTTHQKIKK